MGSFSPPYSHYDTSSDPNTRSISRSSFSTGSTSGGLLGSGSGDRSNPGYTYDISNIDIDISNIDFDMSTKTEISHHSSHTQSTQTTMTDTEVDHSYASNTRQYDSMVREKNAHQEYNHCDEKDTKIDPSNRLIKILKKIQFNLGTKKENTKKGGKTGDLPYPGPGGTGDPVPWNFSPLCDSQSQGEGGDPPQNTVYLEGKEYKL
eukprot:CAMPEP_0119043346 /NCGR_PEP_ID=MMETSP1177-20130426/21095_1 /TAXON_ID=2985 /ORGANISM="Ochromonas sp, Strain CCMP1899" /LENGTH=204 /DNA_ID=CAMNT_0007011255 /DNA_START=2122 /DNA_END=2736 /DNA_ORIENTATION=-